MSSQCQTETLLAGWLSTQGSFEGPWKEQDSKGSEYKAESGRGASGWALDWRCWPYVYLVSRGFQSSHVSCVAVENVFSCSQSAWILDQILCQRSLIRSLHQRRHTSYCVFSVCGFQPRGSFEIQHCRQPWYGLHQKLRYEWPVTWWLILCLFLWLCVAQLGLLSWFFSLSFATSGQLRLGETGEGLCGRSLLKAREVSSVDLRASIWKYLGQGLRFQTAF